MDRKQANTMGELVHYFCLIIDKFFK